jgi:hypothetical protein
MEKAVVCRGVIARVGKLLIDRLFDGSHCMRMCLLHRAQTSCGLMLGLELALVLNSNTEISGTRHIVTDGGVVRHVGLRSETSKMSRERAEMVFAFAVVQLKALHDEELDSAVDFAGMAAEEDQGRDGARVADGSLDYRDRASHSEPGHSSLKRLFVGDDAGAQRRASGRER